MVISVTLFFAACSNQPGETSIVIGQTINLSSGQVVSITGEQLKIQFLEVITDSRCPSGVTCIWEGEVSCLIEITFQDSTNRLVLNQRSSAISTIEFGDYNITYEVLPYPKAGENIENKEYILRLTVNKQPALSGGILATFDVLGEKYSIFITNKETIEQVVAAQRGDSQATIPSGRLLKGSVSYNLPWNWHIDSEDIHMAEITIELCDGTPSQVEANLDYWVETVQRFCPWSAKIVKIEDFR